MRELGDDVTYLHSDTRTQPFIVKDSFHPIDKTVLYHYSKYSYVTTAFTFNLPMIIKLGHFVKIQTGAGGTVCIILFFLVMSQGMIMMTIYIFHQSLYPSFDPCDEHDGHRKGGQLIDGEG